ncbi:MAG TPA: terminase small subunit, partial [Myxococcales bacterium]|nr:terminase small subunit [Myxococcales bacterium]
MKPNQLTPRQERFAHEFVVDRNATAAAIRAGYARRGAESAGSRLLTNIKVAHRIAELTEAQVERIKFTADDVLREVQLLATSNIADFMDATTGGVVQNLSELPRDVLAAIESIKETRSANGEVVRTLKLYNKVQALRVAGTHVDVGAFLEKLEV